MDKSQIHQKPISVGFTFNGNACQSPCIIHLQSAEHFKSSDDTKICAVLQKMCVKRHSKVLTSEDNLFRRHFCSVPMEAERTEMHCLESSIVSLATKVQRRLRSSEAF